MWSSLFLPSSSTSSSSSSSTSSSSSCLPLLRGAERLALQQQRKDGMSTGFREKWAEGKTQRWELHLVAPSLTSKVFTAPRSPLPFFVETRLLAQVVGCSAAPVTRAHPETLCGSDDAESNFSLPRPCGVTRLSFFLSLSLQTGAAAEESRRWCVRVLVVLSGRLVILLWRWSKNNKSQSASQHKQSSSVHVSSPVSENQFTLFSCLFSSNNVQTAL